MWFIKGHNFCQGWSLWSLIPVLKKILATPLSNTLTAQTVTNNWTIWRTDWSVQFNCYYKLQNSCTNVQSEHRFWSNSPQWAMASSFTRFLDHKQWCTTVGRTPLDKWSVCHRDLYVTTQNTHKWQTSMPPVGFEPTISDGERPQTYSLDRAATGTRGITSRQA